MDPNDYYALGLVLLAGIILFIALFFAKKEKLLQAEEKRKLEEEDKRKKATPDIKAGTVVRVRRGAMKGRMMRVLKVRKGILFLIVGESWISCHPTSVEVFNLNGDAIPGNQAQTVETVGKT